jgi:predicted RNase H-like HicB family nuclease
MKQPMMAFTAVYLKAKHGYVGFVEELPGVISHGATIEEARRKLRELAEMGFDPERQKSRELLAGKDSVREEFMIPLRPAD